MVEQVTATGAGGAACGSAAHFVAAIAQATRILKALKDMLVCEGGAEAFKQGMLKTLESVWMAFIRVSCRIFIYIKKKLSVRICSLTHPPIQCDQCTEWTPSAKAST